MWLCEKANSAPHEFSWLRLGWLGGQQRSLFLVGGDALLMFSPSNRYCCWSGEGLSRSLPLSFLFQLPRPVQEQGAPCLPSATPACFCCVRRPRGREGANFPVLHPQMPYAVSETSGKYWENR